MESQGWNRVANLRGHELSVGRFAWSPDGSRLATPSSDGRVVIWDPRTGKPLVERNIGLPALAVAWSPNAESLAVSVEDRIPFDHNDLFEAEFEMSESRGGEDELLRAFEHGVTPLGGEPGEIVDEGALHLRLLDARSGLQVGAMQSQWITEPPTHVAWLADGQHLAALSMGGISLWDAQAGHFLGWLEDSRDLQYQVLLRSGDLLIGAGPSATTATLWNADSGEVIQTLRLGGRCISGGVDPSSSYFALGSMNGLVEVMRPGELKSQIRTLEGHAGAVTGISFSRDGSLLATAAQDGVKLWNTKDWSLLSEWPFEVPKDAASSIAFSPVASVLAVLGPTGTDVEIWSFDMAFLAARQDRPSTVHYANARVVLLGDTGVGKSGLGLVLAGKKFEPTESTHRRNIWTLSTRETTGPHPERREILLWDLAGQPGYRLVHQLHLSDVSVALVVFDAKDELDPLSGVRYWCRALDQAERVDSTDGAMRRILVAARMDRGGAKVSDRELREVRQRFNLVQYVTTSAKAGENIKTLRDRIEESIDWAKVPKVSSTGLFEAIRGFLVAKTGTDTVLATETELREAFTETGVVPRSHVLEEFRVCVDRLQSRGLVRRLTFGDLVLLQPELLDAYAAAVINAAAEQPDLLGAISEEDVREGRFLISDEDRLKHPETERLLLIATIEDLLKHEVALREDSSDGTYLVFPTQARREQATPSSLRSWCRISFEGPVPLTWATLVVRLSHSGVFIRDEVWRNEAAFRGAGRSLAVRLKMTDEGAGRLELLSERGLKGGDTEQLFEGFVLAHLDRRAVAGSVDIEYVVACTQCKFQMPEQLLEAFAGKPSLRCPECGGDVDLQAQIPEASRATKDGIVTLEKSADRERSRVAARTSVQGKEELLEFDVFLAHNSGDKEAVNAIADRLRDFGLNPWMDSDQIPPGRWFQDIIQEAIGRVRSAAIVMGQSGLGRWQNLELKAFISACVEEHIPVIPTLLPGASMPDQLQPFLRELQLVKFERSINEKKPFANLIWGITGDREDREKVLRG